MFTPGPWAKPIAALYSLAMRVRNWLYDKGYIRSHSFTVPLISWGNLSVGGTGKSPHTEYVASLLLAKQYRIGILSRGYGRKTKGYRLANDAESADTMGDEPWQYYLRFEGAAVKVAVAERRAEGIPNLMLEAPDTQAIVLDDAFQHRRIRPQLNLLLTRYDLPFWRDEVLPAGWLREAPEGAARASALVISKCPDNLTRAESARLTNEASKYLQAGAPVFFSALTYGSPKPLRYLQDANPQPSLDWYQLWESPSKPVLGAFCGLAAPTLFREQVERLAGTTTWFKELPDHVTYDHQLLDTLLKEGQAAGVTLWLCTAKDRAKLLHPSLASHPIIKQCWYVPVTVHFPDSMNTTSFDDWLLSRLTTIMPANPAPESPAQS